MSPDAERFRQRARDCLNVAKGTHLLADRTVLEEMADELSAEADKIDAEEKAKSDQLQTGRFAP